MLKTKIVNNPIQSRELCLHIAGADCEESVDAYTASELEVLIEELQAQLERLKKRKQLEDDDQPNLFNS